MAFVTARPDLEEAGPKPQPYAAALNRAAAAVEAIAADLPEQAQYAVPMAFRIRWQITFEPARRPTILARVAQRAAGPPELPAQSLRRFYEQIRAVHPNSGPRAMRFRRYG